MLIKVPEKYKIPLIGIMQIGIIDRGSSLIQVRYTTCCNLNCTFCSTAAGDHKVNYTVDADYLITWVREVIRLKENKITEINLDSMGEPTFHPEIIKIVKECKKLVPVVSMQTNGTLLTKEKIKDLEKAGLTRLNFSIHTLNEEKAKQLSGDHYPLKKIISNLKEVSKTKIELNLTPVWIPKTNDEDMSDLIEFSKELKAKISIQKYETYKYSRRLSKAISWFKFYKNLSNLEKKHNIKLKIGPKDFEIQRVKRIPTVMDPKDKLNIKVIAPGWRDGEMIGEAKHRAITILNCDKQVGDSVNIEIVDNKNNIYMAKQI
jgi:uncharacterized protein